MAAQNPPVVLVADDDDDIRGIVSSIVESLGYEVIQASDGAKAVALAETRLPNLAVLDLMMPELTGNQVCQRIRACPGGELVPVIILTARDTLKDKVDALEGGADDYLTKPFHPQELMARIKALSRVSDLNLKLKEKNEELKALQDKLVEKERQFVAMQLAGTAAHQLGQPLSAIMLNCHLIENLKSDDHRYQNALSAIKSDTRRMAELIEKLREVKANRLESYYGETEILDLEDGPRLVKSRGPEKIQTDK